MLVNMPQTVLNRTVKQAHTPQHTPLPPCLHFCQLHTFPPSCRCLGSLPFCTRSRKHTRRCAHTVASLYIFAFLTHLYLHITTFLSLSTLFYPIAVSLSLSGAFSLSLPTHWYSLSLSLSYPPSQIYTHIHALSPSLSPHLHLSTVSRCFVAAADRRAATGVLPALHHPVTNQRANKKLEEEEEGGGWWREKAEVSSSSLGVQTTPSH